MLILNAARTLADATAQLETIEKNLDDEQVFLITTIALCFDELHKTAKNKHFINIMIDGIKSFDIVQKIHLISGYLPTDMHINLLFTNIIPPFDEIVHGNVSIKSSHYDLKGMLKHSADTNTEVHSVILFNIDDKYMESSLAQNEIQPFFKKRNTRLIMCHNSHENEILRLIQLKKYNANEIKTVMNRFSYGTGKYKTASKISLIDMSRATRNKGFVAAEATIRKIQNNTYFDPRFNSFGLHLKLENDNGTNRLVMFDYELFYDIENFSVIKIVNSETQTITTSEKDPFPILTRELKCREFNSIDDTPYITLAEKERASAIRNHYSNVINARKDELVLRAKESVLEAFQTDDYDKILQTFLTITNGHPLRDVTTKDRKAFQALHHQTESLIEELKTDKTLYLAENNRGSELIFEIVRSDDLNEQVKDFLHNAQSLAFDIHRLDDGNYTLLDNALAAGATENAKTLIEMGFNINHQCPFGHTCKHKMYADGNEGAVAFLIGKGAKDTLNCFHKTPEQMHTEEEQPTEIEIH